MYVLVSYVPETHLEQVKNALFEAGAGAIGNYSSCSWQVKGEGQFKPEAGSKPFLGRQAEVERVSEYRLELVCPQEKMHDIAAALKGAHPYEEPAYHFIQAVTIDDCG